MYIIYILNASTKTYSVKLSFRSNYPMTKYSRENSYFLNNYRNILLSILFCFEKKIYD